VENPERYLKEIFEERIGKYYLNEGKTLSQIYFFKPNPDMKKAYFEELQLKENCWRIDIYPPNECHKCSFYIGHFSFCLKDKEQHQLTNRYTYLLEPKELVKNNKE